MPRGRGRSKTNRGGRKSQRNRRTPARFQNVETIDVTDSPPQESSARNGDPTVLVQSTNPPSDVITVSRSELADLVRSLQQQGNSAPVVEKALSLAPEGSTVIYCGVGNRDFWKDQSNDFRKHPQFKVTGVPTLLQIGTPKRLVEEQLMKEDLLQMFFEE
uniref:Thioredoxin domain-containing protein 17 n=1 Tax=Saccoglossus kowalevskii TaxID=10224 RepID=A0ABM0MII3_SACKO|nr:PREDICTED: uncharacterized protein LOC102809271 [Saccoglossus kowalevskii]